MQPLTPEELADPVNPYIRIRQTGRCSCTRPRSRWARASTLGLPRSWRRNWTPTSTRSRSSMRRTARGRRGTSTGTRSVAALFQITGGSNSTQASGRATAWSRPRRARVSPPPRLSRGACRRGGRDRVGRHLAPERQAGHVRRARRARRAAAGSRRRPAEAIERTTQLIGARRTAARRRRRQDPRHDALHDRRDLPGMLTAVVLHPPRFGATPASVDDRAALAEPGVDAVVPIDEGVAVVGETFADAQRGLRALNVEWDDSDAEQRSSPSCWPSTAGLSNRASRPWSRGKTATPTQVLAERAHVVDAIYELPYLAHAPMEPNNAVCRMSEDGVLEVWASTESPEYTRMSAPRRPGSSKDQVEVHVPFAGGSFGLHSTAGRRSHRRGRADRAGARLEAPGQGPVAARGGIQERAATARWPCTAYEPRPTHNGRLTAFHQRSWPSRRRPTCRSCATSCSRTASTSSRRPAPSTRPYAFENFKVEATNFESGVPTMVWRSVGNSHTEFARESAIDELAIAAGRDPVDLRRELLADNPRTLRALELAAETPGGERRCRKGAHAASRAPASSATAPR